MRCPICDKTLDPKQTASLPFCSQRCRDIDLGRWLSEDYAVPLHRVTKDDPEAAEEFLTNEEAGSDVGDD